MAINEYLQSAKQTAIESINEFCGYVPSARVIEVFGDIPSALDSSGKYINLLSYHRPYEKIIAAAKSGESSVTLSAFDLGGRWLSISNEIQRLQNRAIVNGQDCLLTKLEVNFDRMH